MEMEKTCEFCVLLKPVVYCEAAAAHLCLSCEAKVHSANAFSNCHPRTLVCESCGHNLTYIRCSDPEMFMCRACDRRHHDLSSQHQRKLITSYMGRPPAKDLAALWGFALQDLENITPSEQFISTSNGTVNGAKVAPKFGKRYHSSARGSSLTSELAFTGPVVSTDSEVGSSSNHTELWPQNLQDLGAYVELECFDNSNMPDVDLTFQNFEELFGEEQERNNVLLNEEDMTCSSMENDSSIDKSDYS